MSNWLLLFVVCFVGLVCRCEAIHLISSDARDFLFPWFYMIKEYGLTSLSEKTCDYSLLYQTIILFFTQFDVEPIYMFKWLSILFDFLLTFSVLYFVVSIKPDVIYAFCVGCILLLPTIFTNSAYWAQCDSIYTFFLLWTTWFLYKEKYLWAFVMYGLAFSFKLQSILYLPVFLLYIYKDKKMILGFIVSFVVFWFSGIVGYWQGKGLLDGFRIYFRSTTNYPLMSINIPNFWSLWSLDFYTWYRYAILLTCIILLAGFFIIIKSRKGIMSFENLLMVVAFTEWTCIMFLPGMHERYAYVLDVVLVLLFLLNKKYAGYVFVSVGISMITYGRFLFYIGSLHMWHAIVYILAYLHFCYLLYNSFCKEENSLKNVI